LKTGGAGALLTVIRVDVWRGGVEHKLALLKA
jgi:hypothetical protein